LRFDGLLPTAVETDAEWIALSEFFVFHVHPLYNGDVVRRRRLINLLEALLADGSRRCGRRSKSRVVLRNCAHIRRSLGQLYAEGRSVAEKKHARVHFQASIRNLRSVDDGGESLCLELLGTMLDLGNCYEESPEAGTYRLALRWYGKASAYAADCRHRCGTDALRVISGIVSYNLGDWYYRTGRNRHWNAAILHYEQALGHFARCRKQNDGQPDWWRNQSICHTRLSTMYFEANGDEYLKMALHHGRRALEIDRKIYLRHRTEQALLDYVQSHIVLSNSCAEGGPKQKAEAVVLCRRAVELARQAASQLGSSHARSVAAQAYGSLANALVAARGCEGAREAIRRYEGAKRILSGLLKDGDSVGELRNLSCTYFRCAEAYALLGDVRNLRRAVRCLVTSSEIDVRLYRQFHADVDRENACEASHRKDEICDRLSALCHGEKGTVNEGEHR